MDLLREFELQQIKGNNRPNVRAGDIVRVETKVQEGNKTRLQKFEGTIIAVKGSGPSRSFTVRRETAKYGVERIFPLYSPVITNIDIVKRQKVRRAKLNYLRQAGRRRVKEDELAMQRHIHEEKEKERLAAEAKKREEEKLAKEEAEKAKQEKAAAEEAPAKAEEK
jgi:large subunit ribosomal protein L19